MTNTQTQAETVEDRLRRELPPGTCVYTVLRHVSKSGMTRWIDLYKLTDGEPVWLTGQVAKVLGERLDRRYESLRVNGCGMDMGFSLVYNLSYTLYPKGFDCLHIHAVDTQAAWRDAKRGEDCPSNDHANHRQSSGEPCPDHHTEGGYALRHRWL